MFFDWIKGCWTKFPSGVAISCRVFPLHPIFAPVLSVSKMNADEWDSTELGRLGILTDMITLLTKPCFTKTNERIRFGTSSFGFSLRVIRVKIDAKKALALTTKMTRGKANVTKGVSFWRNCTAASGGMRFFYGQNIEHGYINVLFNYVIVMRYNTSLKIK